MIGFIDLREEMIYEIYIKFLWVKDMEMEICQDCFCLNCPRIMLPINQRGYCEVCSKCDSRSVKVIFSKSECSVCMWRVEYERVMSEKTASRRSLEILRE